jgi:hypothetical protein
MEMKLMSIFISKIDTRGYLGTSDLMIEIISPKTPKHDLKDNMKFTRIMRSRILDC